MPSGKDLGLTGKLVWSMLTTGKTGIGLDFPGHTLAAILGKILGGHKETRWGVATLIQGTHNRDGERYISQWTDARYERKKSVKDHSEGFGLKCKEQGCHWSKQRKLWKEQVCGKKVRSSLLKRLSFVIIRYSILSRCGEESWIAAQRSQKELWEYW